VLGAGAAGFLGVGFVARVAGLSRMGFFGAVLRALLVFGLVFFDFVLRMMSP